MHLKKLMNLMKGEETAMKCYRHRYETVLQLNIIIKIITKIITLKYLY